MVDSIEKAIYPFSLVSFIFGFGILRQSLDRPRLRLSIFYMLTVWSVYAFVFHCVMVFFSPKRIFTGFIHFFIVIINLFVTMISIIIAVFKHKEYLICMKKLSLVDDTLEKLGISKEYREMRNSIKWALIMWLTVICLTWITDSLWIVERLNDIRAIVVPFVMNYTIHVNTCMDIMFIFILRCIGIRLNNINQHIEQMSKTEEYGLRCTWKKSVIVTRHYGQSMEKYKPTLWIVMHLHSELCKIARDINRLYGIQMTLQMVTYFVVLTGMFYVKYDMMLCLTRIYGGDAAEMKVILSTNMWFIVFLMKFILLNHICENVSAKAQKTKGVIHKLTNLLCFAKAREEICQFVLQISLLPLRFNGMGLFYFGYKFIRTFFVWILTIIILMVQMDSPISRMMISISHNVTCYNS